MLIDPHYYQISGVDENDRDITNHLSYLILEAADEKGIDTVLALIEGHFEQGGTLININVLDGEKLIRANKNPELYPGLVVRVTGFTAYFTSLSPTFRQLVVDRFLQGI